jgi:hypothetical protein
MFRFNQLLEAPAAITPLLGSGFFFEIVCSDQIETGRFMGGRNGRKEKFGPVMIWQMMGNGTLPVPAQAGSITGCLANCTSPSLAYGSSC